MNVAKFTFAHPGEPRTEVSLDERTEEGSKVWTVTTSVGGNIDYQKYDLSTYDLAMEDYLAQIALTLKS